jgi:thymidylate synthase
MRNDTHRQGRKIVSLWQESDLHETAGLAPCAFLTIWNVRNNGEGKEYLDMCLVQRSGDMLTASGAGGINEIQYAALLMMIARHCGYEAGVFTHFVANEQIYDRHEEQAKEMINRYFIAIGDTNTELPKLVLNPEKTNFYDFTIDDFKMENYNPMKPQLKFELGI